MMINLIKNTPLLYSIKEEELTRLLESNQLSIRKYQRQEIIHFDGEKCNKLEVILEGEVKVERLRETGELFTISEFSDGDILGGNIVFSSRPNYLMNVTAMTDVTMLQIPKSILFELLESNTDFLRIFLEYISDTTTILGNKLRNHVSLPLRDNITNYLLRLSKEQSSHIVELKHSKKDIAEMLGCQRTSLSRELSKMERDQLIKVNRNFIEIIALKK
jgi:CRP-like cAMP-binding protein